MNNENNNLNNNNMNNQNINMQNQFQNNNGMNADGTQQQVAQPTFNSSNNVYQNTNMQNQFQNNNGMNIGQPQQMPNGNPGFYNMGQQMAQPNINTMGNVSNKSNSNKGLFIILGVVAIVAVIAIILFFNYQKTEKIPTNTNDYEENDSSSQGTNNNNNNNNNNNGNSGENNNTNSEDIQNYQGFNFQKLAGYKYYIQSDALIVEGTNYIVVLCVSEMNFDAFKQNYRTSINSSLKQKLAGQIKLQSYLNTEVVTYEIKMQSYNALYYVLASPSSKYVYEGYVVSKTNTYDYSGINEVVNITKNSKYAGNYSNHSNEFATEIDLNNFLNK